jgi:aryl-alcohol dehydrogenase-like predicted oxidoreductase
LYFLELATIGLLFAVVMDETFAGPRLSRPALADQLLRLILAGTSHQVHSNVSTEASLADRQLHHLRQVGNSELMISPLGLGKIGSGPFRKSSTRDDLKDVFELYTSLGGNFVEVENASDDCSFHDLVAEFVKDKRQELIVSLNLNLSSGREILDPVRTFRLRLMQSVEENLSRLGTDVIDLLYVGKFDPRLPLEEVLGACDDLIEGGKIRFVGMSDVPAWQAARLLTLAEVRGCPRIVTLRVPYGLTVREPETDQLPLAQEMGLSVTSWAPFTGDYLPVHPASSENAEGHFGAGAFASFSEPGIRSILNAIEAIARELGRTPAQVALAWKFVHPTIASLLVYPTNVDQLDEFLIALQIVFSDDQLRRLDSVSRMIASPTQRIEASLSG